MNLLTNRLWLCGAERFNCKSFAHQTANVLTSSFCCKNVFSNGNHLVSIQLGINLHK